MKKTIPTIAVVFICSLLLIGSCKKKKDSDDLTDDNNNNNTKTLPASCSLVSISSSTTAPSTSYTINYNYSYNSDGLESTYSYRIDGGSATTTNYTYTKNSSGQVIKKDEGGGTYREIQYNSDGKISQFKDYNSNALSFTYTYTYETNKITLNMYNASSQLMSKTVFTMSGNNPVSQDYTSYHTGTSNVSTETHYTYTGYDNKYSTSYIRSLHDPAITTEFKNNYTGYTFTSTSYNTSGGVTLTMSSTDTETYTYNENGTVATSNSSNSTSVNGAASTTTTVSQTYSYSGCD